MVAKSLKLLQTLRLLSSNDEKSISYLVYWIGGVLSDPDPDFDKGPHPLILPEFFQELALIFADAQISEIVAVSNWRRLTHRNIYSHYLKSLTTCKVEIDSGYDISYFWKRLLLPTIGCKEREILLLLVHRKLPTLCK